MGTTRAHLVALDPPDDPLGTAGLEALLGTPVPLPALELPRSRRPGWPMLTALAVACGLAAVLLGAWALLATVRSDGASAPTPTPTLERSVAVLTDARAERIPLHGSLGRIVLVVGEDGAAVLALDGLGAAPDGRVYAAWLVRPGSATPLPAGTFTGTERVVFLERPVPRGGRVGMTLESDPPPDRPSRTLRLAAVRP